MIIVSDTSPISNLFAVGRLKLLKENYQQVIIPQTVYDEVMKLESLNIRNLTWIEKSVVQPDLNKVRTLQRV